MFKEREGFIKFTITIPVSTVERLEQRAEKAGRSRAEMLRRLLMIGIEVAERVPLSEDIEDTIASLATAFGNTNEGTAPSTRHNSIPPIVPPSAPLRKLNMNALENSE